MVRLIFGALIVSLVWGEDLSTQMDIPFTPVYTLDQLEADLKQNNVTDFESLSKLFPKQLFSRFTLVKESRSRQGASAMFPRAITFGPNAMFVMTFNGSPEQKNHYSIEMFEASREKGTFTFATVELDPQGQKQAHLNRDATRCLGCHGPTTDTLHPIWDNYPAWRGLYGGRDDLFDPESGEAKQYVEFLGFVESQEPDHKRYQVLNFQPIYRGQHFPPYMNRGMDYFRTRNFINRPNLQLTVLLQRLNGFRMARLIKESPHWQDPEKRKEAILLLCACVPSKTNIYTNGRHKLEESNLIAERLFDPKSYSGFYDRQASSIARLKVALETMHLDPMSYSLGKGDDTHTYYDGHHEYTSLPAEIASRLLESLFSQREIDAKLDEYHDYWMGGRGLLQFAGHYKEAHPTGRARPTFCRKVEKLLDQHL